MRLWLIDRRWPNLRCDAAVGGEGTWRCNDGGTASICCVELPVVLGGLALVLKLGGHGRGAGAAHGCEFGGLRADVDAASAAVVGDAGVVVDDYGAVVDIGDVVDVDAVDGAVVVEAVSIPVAAMVAVAGVSEAIVDASVVADVRTPEAGMEAIAVTEEEPVAGCPEGSGIGGGDPGSGNPVVASGSVTPVAGRPEIVRRGSWGLVVDGERGRRLIGFERCLSCVYLIIVGGVGLVAVGWVLRLS